MFLKIKESELKQITLFLIDKKIIFHPVISPNGFPDFSNHIGRRNILILDRNILTPMIRLLAKGYLKDEYSLRVIGSIILWSQFNNISITAGLALSEYANYKGGDEEASLENDLFLKIFNSYPPNIWLEIALGRSKKIKKLSVNTSKTFSFNTDFDHYKMHYLEMLKIAQLYFDTSISVEEKIMQFHKWVYDNLMICRYTISYFALLIKGRINTFKSKTESNLNEIIESCKNQAWDLSYLSLWSTLYSKENETDTNYLFATLDKALKDVFISGHRDSIELHLELFGNKAGKINDLMINTFKNRQLPKINIEMIEDLTKIELEKLCRVLA